MENHHFLWRRIRRVRRIQVCMARKGLTDIRPHKTSRSYLDLRPSPSFSKSSIHTTGFNYSVKKGRSAMCRLLPPSLIWKKTNCALYGGQRPHAWRLLLCMYSHDGAVKLVLWRHWMHGTQVHPVTAENQFHYTRLHFGNYSVLWKFPSLTKHAIDFSWVPFNWNL